MDDWERSEARSGRLGTVRGPEWAVGERRSGRDGFRGDGIGCTGRRGNGSGRVVVGFAYSSRLRHLQTENVIQHRKERFPSLYTHGWFLPVNLTTRRLLGDFAHRFNDWSLDALFVRPWHMLGLFGHAQLLKSQRGRALNRSLRGPCDLFLVAPPPGARPALSSRADLCPLAAPQTALRRREGCDRRRRLSPLRRISRVRAVSAALRHARRCREVAHTRAANRRRGAGHRASQTINGAR